MEDLHQQICNSQKALLARVHHVQFLFLDGFERIVNLNLQAVRSRFDDAAGRGKSSGEQSGLPDPLAQFAHRLQHQFDRNLAYGRQIGEIIEGLQADLRELTLTEPDHIRHSEAAAPSPAQPIKSPARRKARPAVQAAPARKAGKARTKNQTAVVPAKEVATKAPSRIKRKAAVTPAKQAVVAGTSKPAQPTAGKRAGRKPAHDAVPHATTASETSRAVPAASSVEMVKPQPSANVIGHLVAQTVPGDSEKASSRS